MRSNDHTERVTDYLVVEGKLQPLQRKPAREHYKQRPSKGDNRAKN